MLPVKEKSKHFSLKFGPQSYIDLIESIKSWILFKFPKKQAARKDTFARYKTDAPITGDTDKLVSWFVQSPPPNQ